jgi:methylase of polypeptide subunit release factors
VGILIFNDLARRIDSVAAQCVPLSQTVATDLEAWAALHGWDAHDPAFQRLFLCQATLNALLRQTVPGLAERAFATPLDKLEVTAPSELVEAFTQEMRSAAQTRFNPWGEFCSILVPQPQRRQIGQFWTDESIADWMAAWLLQGDPRFLSDVGCGAGNFLLKLAQLSAGRANAPRLHGCDISPLVLNVAQAAFLTRPEREQLALPEFAVRNYLETPLPPETDAIICNPPYTRHHQIAPALKDALQAFLKARLGLDVSRQGTLAFFFLLKLIAEMREGARAAVIVPMEVLDARYGLAAKRVLCQQTAISSIIQFSPQMNAFRKVDVGALILLFRKGYERGNWVRHLTLTDLPATGDLLAALDSARDGDLPFGSLVVRPQEELLDTPKWLAVATPAAAPPEWREDGLVVPLKALAKIVRGIATGANDFFALPADRVQAQNLEPFVVRTLQRNREAQDLVLDESDWQTLADEGKRVYLLYLNGEDVSRHPQLLTYLASGEAQGYQRRSLVQTRRQWYMMEQRAIPPIFFTILTRGNPRFILNRAEVRPLNMFSLIYPNRTLMQAGAAELLWALLNSDFSISRLHSVSRTYGGNTLKVEPRELDNLPVINPLALPQEARQKLESWIADFLRDRQADRLLTQVNELITAILSAIPGEIRSTLPVQLRLLDSEAEYVTDPDQ